MSNKTPVGEVRPSQLLWTYGPGALIDLPNLSVVTQGTDRWEKDRCQPIQEAVIRKDNMSIRREMKSASHGNSLFFERIDLIDEPFGVNDGASPNVTLNMGI